jgi:TRAP-type C4-dicarboxylate transport system permease small subunit
MTKRTRRLLVVAAVLCGAIAVVMFLLSAGAGLASSVSNCNRDCDDGTRAMYAAFVFGGVTVVLSILAALGRTPPPPPRIPEARVRSE